MAVRVLLIDDDAEFCTALQAVLREAGFTVRVANNGAHALQILNEAHATIDVAIVDLNLPEVNGFEVIGAITRRPTAMRVIATSGVYQPTYLQIAQHLGAHIAIPKPAKLDDLKEWIPAIRSILNVEGEMGRASGALS